MVMEHLQSLLIDCYSESSEEPNTKEIYPLFSRLQLKDDEVELFKSKFLPTIFSLCDQSVLRKDLTFLSLLANKDQSLLESFIYYEINLPFNLASSTSLFLQTYHRNRYWLEEVLTRTFNLNAFEHEIRNNVTFARLLVVTNAKEVDLKKIQRALSKAEIKHEDELVNVYLDEIRYILNVINYIGDVAENHTELFSYISKNSLLKIFNTYLPLSDSSVWDSIVEQLKNDEQRKSAYQYNSEQANACTDLETFTTYTIISNVIESVKLSRDQNGSNIAQIINKTEEKLITLNNEHLQTNLLEDIFALCFLRGDHFDTGSEKQFLCSQQELRLILLFLKSCLDKIRTVHDQTCNAKLKRLNRYVTDALWRLETVADDEMQCRKAEFLAYMLARPETLIKLCLKRGQFEKAVQVIQIFNLNETDLARNVIYTEQLSELKASLEKCFKIRNIQKEVPQITSHLTDVSAGKIVHNFFTSLKDVEDKETIISNEQTFCDIFDVTIVSLCGHNDAKELLDVSTSYFNESCFTKEYVAFYKSVKELFLDVGEKDDLSIRQLLTNAKYNLNLDKHKANEDFYKEIRSLMNLLYAQLKNKPNGNLNSKHVAHNTFMKLTALLTKDDTRYLQRLFNYLKSILKLFSVEGNHNDILSKGKSVSFFEILKYSRSEIFGKLVFDRSLDPQDLENISSKLKIDCLYHTAFNCFPRIEVTGDDDAVTVMPVHEPSKMVFSYIQKRNWLLAYIVKEMYDLRDFNMDISENRTKYFSQYINSNNVNRLKILFNNNKIISCLHNNFVGYCIEYLNKNVFHDTENKGDLGNDSFETAQEIIEGDYSCNWKYLLNLLNSIPEYQVKGNDSIDKIKDRILSNLVLDDYESDHYKYVQYIKNDSLRTDIIFEHFSGWPGEFCMVLMNMELARENNTCKSVMEDWLKVIGFCEEVKTLFNYKIWFDVHELCCEDQELMMKLLLSNPKVHLLLNFLELYHVNELLSTAVTIDCFKKMFESNEDLNGVQKLMLKLPDELIIDISKTLLKSVRNLKQSQFLIDHLTKINYQDSTYIRNVQMSVDMMHCFYVSERDQIWCLIDKPMHIIELLVMNTKLDKFGLIMETLRPELEMLESYDEEVSLDSVDELLRKYAEKSLEFRVIMQPHPKLLQGSDNKLMQSLDSLYGPDRKHFEMPPMVPDKTEWTPNNEVVECMCCQNTTFSMFNRRHHCRRCGRVVCFNCSTRRMHVPSYGDILVRVCIDCYEQSHTDGNSSTMSDASNKSIMYDYWLLTDDEEHNAIVRQEFSYEHAPSVSLCLSIMRHHSRNIDYAEFLLDQCDNMLKLLQPVSPNGPQEVDYMLVVKMMKSLAIAAKMLSSECCLQRETSQADRILSQADLLGLLAERGCLNLLSNSSHSSTPYVDATVLRKLRDKLLEREQWHFALDVSTKAGLDNAGVFAAWGKSCLKAGCLQLAREKFQRCLDKTGHYDFSDYSLDESFESSHKKRTPRSSTNSETKPLKNPPLLNQIVQILEAQTIKFDNRVKKDLFGNKFKNQSNTSLNKSANLNLQTDPAICIKNKLRNLKDVVLGNFEHDESLTNRLDPVFFQECVYYLGKYGTHLSLAQFYIKHHCMHQALHYMIDNRVTTEVFIEVYMTCLREGKVDVFQEGMATIDSTLDLWKEYLKNICRYLEKQGLLHSLYQLQQFMGDFVRAAMTCIRFYKDNVTSYNELLSNIHFLYRAEEHLKQDLEQQQWVEVNTVRKMSTDSRNSFEEKGLTNPSLVMKMNSRDVDKHINTIRRQIEVTKFLSAHEKEDKQLLKILPNIAPSINEDVKVQAVTEMPTLFDSQHEKVQLTVLIIICGDNVTDGYGIAYQIIQEHKLKPIKVYCQAGKQLAKENRYEGISQLVSCIRSSGVSDSAVTHMCDELLASAIRTLGRNSDTTTATPQLEALIKLITDRAIKISIYIETKQLKSAYLLAAKYNKYADIRRILREAELLNKPDIKKLCMRLLQAHSHSHKDV